MDHKYGYQENRNPAFRARATEEVSFPLVMVLCNQSRLVMWYPYQANLFWTGSTHEKFSSDFLKVTTAWGRKSYTPGLEKVQCYCTKI